MAPHKSKCERSSISTQNEGRKVSKTELFSFSKCKRDEDHKNRRHIGLSGKMYLKQYEDHKNQGV